MRIAVIGGTGTSGTATVEALRHLGMDAVPASRATGTDLHTGEGLADALHGAAVVIDTSNARPSAPSADVATAMGAAARRVVQACAQQRVRHLVFLSICNIDSPEFDDYPYYLAKREQERVIRESGCSATIVRSTQWYEFALNPAAVWFTDAAVEVQDWLIQPIAVRTVAAVLADAVQDRRPTRAVTGPDILRLPELTTRVLAAHGDARPVHAVTPATAGLGNGALLAPPGAEILGPGLESWLSALHRHP
ncbi:SDR family oxidoreductase [Sinomonas terrae]|uniref:NAD(P)H-binding protein n=1 Tax=Sinomonas terrae TaxID=2908838 RepID=A0ABS9U7Y9_9MICC|nr:NAD(P)H-binding protein [Sinomonas terrae]MCH6472482.1 NAD(P)H-binding protein [Sinomonas terrae]